MINPEFFTSTKQLLLKKFFNGLDRKPAKNGVYFVAHTDTVHEDLPTLADIQEHRGILTAPERGLGADDRCGCYITTRLLEMFPDCGFILSHDEETGDTMFEKTTPDLNAAQVLPKIFISFDLKGVNRYTDYGHGSKAIEAYLNNAGIKRENGTGSTCKRLSEKYKVPCVNICFGGGNFHEKNEYVDTYLMERLFEVYTGLVNFAIDNELDYTENISDDLDGKYNDAIDYVDRGIAYIDIGDYVSAIAAFSEAIELDPDYSAAYYFRGDAYSDKGDLDLAIADYTEMIRVEQATHYFKRGNAYYFKGDYDLAIMDYDKVISLKPDNRDAYYNRGGAYHCKGDREQAATDFDCARKISSNPHYIDELYDRNVNYDRAIMNYSRAISLEPNDAEAYNNRGTVYGHKGDYKRAIADFDTAILLAPSDAVTYKNRGNAYSLMGEIDLAIADFTEAIRLKPDFENAHKALAKLNAVSA